MEDIRFLTLFLRTRNEHLTKDVGAIPYYMHRKYGYRASIATYRNEKEYSNLAKEINGVQLLFMKETGFGELVDGILFLLRRAGEIDVLNLYHLSLKSTIWAIIYKLVNKKGILYLKTDASYTTVQKIERNFIRRFFIDKLLTLSDIVSVESLPILNGLRKVISREYLLLPNGYFDDHDQEAVLNKERIVLFVGRVDAPEKNVSLLVDAFINAKLDTGWKLFLVGPYCEDFFQAIKRKCDESNCVLGEDIVLLGPVNARKALGEIYGRSSVFVLPSEYESYGIVLVEALSKGCYLIGSNNIPSFDEISDFEKYGVTTDVHSTKCFANTIHDAAKHHFDDVERIEQQIKYAQRQYSWSNIVEKLNAEIKKLSKNK